MNKLQLAVIERAIHTEQDLFDLNKTWRELYEQYNIGTLQANKICLTPDDKRELVRLAETATGLDLSRRSVHELANLHREEALALAVDEKMAGRLVKDQRLALKTLPGSRLQLNDEVYRLPATGYLDIALEDIMSCQHRAMLVIENYRCFDRLQTLKFKEEVLSYDPLVIFRGDPVFSEHTVRRLLQQFDLPVMVMADIDPQGLLIAQSFPRLKALVIPELPLLQTLLADRKYANSSLYTNQYAGCRKQLNESPHPFIQKVWKILQKHQAGVVQEHWMNGHIELVVFGPD